MKQNVLIDSHGWIAYFANESLAHKYSIYIENADSILITPTIVLYEVYKQIKSKLREEMALRAIAYLIKYSTIVDIDDKITLKAADISLELKLAMADSIIKAVADLNGAKLITGDKHFKGLKGVEFIE